MQADLAVCDFAWPYNKLTSDASKDEHAAVGFLPYDGIPIKTGITYAPYIYNSLSANAVVYMWCTWPFLAECVRMCNAWGLQYITCGFNWVKLNRKDLNVTFGMGRYTAGNSEICLVFRKPTGKPPFRAKLFSQIVLEQDIDIKLLGDIELGNETITIYQPSMGHSKKPEVVQDILELMYPNAVNIELFARRVRPNWYCYGNEITGNDITSDLSYFMKLDKYEHL